MKINSKYEIGNHIWIVYEHQGEVSVYDDVIDEICINENGLYYMLKEACIDRQEQDIILYDDKEKLVEKIEKVMKSMREREKERC